MNVICSMKTVPEVKIRKSNMKFPLVSIKKILTGSRLPEKSPNILPHTWFVLAKTSKSEVRKSRDRCILKVNVLMSWT
jgi:hypothetical protein